MHFFIVLIWKVLQSIPGSSLKHTMARAEAIFNFLFRFVFYRLPKGCKELHREALCTFSSAAHNVSILNNGSSIPNTRRGIGTIHSTYSGFLVSTWTHVGVCVWVHGILSFIDNPVWASRVALVVKNPPANAGDIRDVGSIPGSGRCPGGGHGNLLQYSCLENPMNSGAWWATVHASQRVGSDWSDWARTALRDHRFPWSTQDTLPLSLYRHTSPLPHRPNAWQPVIDSPSLKLF